MTSNWLENLKIAFPIRNYTGEAKRFHISLQFERFSKEIDFQAKQKLICINCKLITFHRIDNFFLLFFSNKEKSLSLRFYLKIKNLIFILKIQQIFKF